MLSFLIFVADLGSYRSRQNPCYPGQAFTEFFVEQEPYSLHIHAEQYKIFLVSHRFLSKAVAT